MASITETPAPPAAAPKPMSRRVRTWLSGLNLAATIALLVVFLLFVNFIAGRRYVRTDLGRTKITALSEKTRIVLKQLGEPVHVYVFYPPTHRLYELVQDLLKEYERQTPKLTVEYVDPEQDLARAKQLVQQFQVDVKRDQINIVILESGTRHKFLSDPDLAEYDYSAMQMTGQPTIKAFKGEDALTSAVMNVTQSSQPLIWITSGHGEKAMDSPEELGLSELKKYLERENMQVEVVTLLEKTEIPTSVGAILIAGPTRRFTEQELLLLEAYLGRGGRMLALIDPLTNTGLDGLLLHWGAELGNDIVVDPARRLPFVSPANLFVTTYTEHPIVKHMATLMTLFPLARSVKAATAGRTGLVATTLAMTSPDGWGETQTQSRPFQFNEGIDVKGPVPIAVASERAGATPTRVVVVGDSDFVADGQVSNVGNLDLLLGAFHWLVGQEQLIGIGPKPLEAIKLNLTAAQMRTVFWLSISVLPCLFAALGVAVWWTRRT